MNLHLQTIAKDALGTFPPVGNDRDAACNYAQRMLTQHFSKIRKSGHPVSENKMQEQRHALNKLIDTLDITASSGSEPMPDNDDAENRETKAPLHTQQLETIISSCFHTATDGSPEHLAVLHRRAIGELNQYLNKADIGWGEKQRLKSKGKRIIDMHLKDIGAKNGDVV